MKIYLAIKYQHDLSNKDLITDLSKHLLDQGHQVFVVHKDVEEWGKKSFSPQELMKRSFELIEDCDLTVIEFSEKGVGLGIEAGYAFSKGKPVVTIARKGSDISTTIRGISRNVVEYNWIKDIVL